MERHNSKTNLELLQLMIKIFFEISTRKYQDEVILWSFEREFSFDSIKFHAGTKFPHHNGNDVVDIRKPFDFCSAWD